MRARSRVRRTLPTAPAAAGDLAETALDAYRKFGTNDAVVDALQAAARRAPPLPTPRDPTLDADDADPPSDAMDVDEVDASDRPDVAAADAADGNAADDAPPAPAPVEAPPAADSEDPAPRAEPEGAQD